MSKFAIGTAFSVKSVRLLGKFKVIAAMKMTSYRESKSTAIFLAALLLIPRRNMTIDEI